MIDKQRFLVDAGSQGLRLDAFLSQKQPELSRAKARKACEQKQVLVNGKPKRAGYSLQLSDEVRVRGEIEQVRARADLVREQGGALSHIRILFEDEHLLAIDKPRMMHSVTLGSDDPITVADCSAAHSAAAAEASSDAREAGLVQRLDYYTSGVLLAAKSSRIWDSLHQLLLGEQVEKEYLALVEGEVTSKNRTIYEALVDAGGGRKVAVAEEGRPAHSRVELLEVLDNQSLVLVRGSGMRRHQVRAHLAHIGHPLVGDDLYGAKAKEFKLKSSSLELQGEGFFLHSLSIRLRHPVSGEDVVVRSEVT